MINRLNTLGRVAGTLFAAALLLSAQGRSARPGALNYTEGQVTVNGQAVNARQLRSTEVGPGQVLETQDGKAEMLLTPGVFVRLGDHSAMKMVASSLIDTRVELLRGTAMVEADQVLKENHLAVIDHGATTLILKHGVYAFKVDQPTVLVYDGHAKVQQDDRTADLFKGEEVSLGSGNPKLKTKGFNIKANETSDPLYAWSKLRSEYSAEANMSTAQTVVMGNPGGWYGTGWYWNPYFDSFAFMPGAGYLYSPFGWGFYSPAFWGGYIAPYYGFGRYPIFPGRVSAISRTSALASPTFGGFAGRTMAAPAARSFGGGFGGGMRVGGGGRR